MQKLTSPMHIDIQILSSPILAHSVPIFCVCHNPIIISTSIVYQSINQSPSVWWIQCALASKNPTYESERILIQRKTQYARPHSVGATSAGFTHCATSINRLLTPTAPYNCCIIMRVWHAPRLAHFECHATPASTPTPLNAIAFCSCSTWKCQITHGWGGRENG